MSNITVIARFTIDDAPATGLTLADIDLYLKAIRKSDAAVTVVWDGTQNPSAEIAGDGAYLKIYASADLTTYDYIARAEYTGATVLDVDHVYGKLTVEAAQILPPAIPFPYEVDRDVLGGDPVDGVDVWITTDLAGTNIIWRGVTDSFGVARLNGSLPYLDPGPYYFNCQKIGYVFNNPDLEVVG